MELYRLFSEVIYNSDDGNDRCGTLLYVNTQAVLININDWNTDDCRKWLYSHGYMPLRRARNTNTFFRFRIIQPNYNKYNLVYIYIYIYRIKTIQKSSLIKIILQYNK